MGEGEMGRGTTARNPNYLKPERPYLEGLTLVTITDAGTAAAAIKAGKITMTTAVTSLGVDDALRLAPDLQGNIHCPGSP